jgi:hypothetical protein
VNKEDIVTITSEDIALYTRARAINLPAIVVSMYGDRLKMLIAEEREACADIAENWNCNGMPRIGVAAQIRARGKHD